MNKQDWLYVSLKVLGVFLVVSHLPTFLTTAFTLVMISTQKTASALSASTVYMWQGPVVSALALCAGLILLFQTKDIVSLLLRDDKK